VRTPAGDDDDCRFSFEMSHSHSGCHPNVAYDMKMRLDLRRRSQAVEASVR
jgi:hypothetical protein